MNAKLLSITGAVLTTLFTTSGFAQTGFAPGPDGANVSLKLEIERAVEKGVKYLKSQQDAETGAWSDPVNPAFTALAITAMMGDPNLAAGQPIPSEIEKGYAFLLSNVKSDGGIYNRGLVTYNTALSLLALSQSSNPEYLPVIAKARRLLINLQADFDKRGVVDNVFDGGIGYGGSTTHSDLSNSHFAMEALYYSKKVIADTPYDDSKEFDLDWDAAIEFVSATQNTEATAKRLGGNYTVREEDRGGFVYYPGSTKSESIELKTEDGERVALRSYGSMTYAGLLAFIYAEMDRDDPRILAAMDWLQRNYTLEENPGMEAQGLYYYFHTMAKALAITGTKELVKPDGSKADWKKDLSLKVMSTQSRDGSWINEASNRWMEDDPVLVTAYALITLEYIYRQL